ncbi:MAG: aminotransferase class I/II-fold pyridoxal phosphate-dependent enzyme, partial [Anaerolineales bacterium]
MQYADRLKNLGTEQAFRVLNQISSFPQERRDKILSFAIGEPDFDTPQNIRDAAKKALDQGYTHYGPSAGLPDFREACANYLNKTRKNVHYEADQIVVTPGAKP